MILTASIALRVVALSLAIYYARRLEARRMAYLAVLFALMASRQGLTLGRSISDEGWPRLYSADLVELPGLLVSLFALIAVIAVARMISRERAASADQEARARALTHAQQMELVGRIAGGIAHDFNNLLTVILFNTDVLARRLEDEPALHELVEDIRLAADRGRRLTSRLLTLARRDTAEPRPIDLSRVVQRMAPLLRRVVPERIELHTHREGEAWGVRADPLQIEQIVLNLVVNAADAIGHAGRIDVGVSQAQGPDGAEVVLSVRDDGSGMSPEVEERAFEAFYTTKPVGTGTGLGLATCQDIVQRLGGRIEVETEEGKGSLFRVYLPQTDEPLEPESPADLADAPSGSETILLAEDEAGVRALMQETLEALGYRVHVARNGEEALQLLEAHAEEIDLVLTDVVMPRAGGEALAAAARQRRPDIALLVVSGYPEGSADALAWVPEGAFLPKPFTGTELGHMVRRLLDRRARRSPGGGESPRPKEP